jgi:hypothetical protein
MAKSSRNLMDPPANPSPGPDADLAALAQAMAITWRHPERGRELAELMAQQGWEAAAQVASFDCQCRALNLAPWD